MKTYLIINPVAGKNRSTHLISRLVDRINTDFPEIQVLFTEKRGDARQFGFDLRNEKVKIVICGGDGTINEVINGLGAHSAPIIDIFPIGSGNDMARELHVTSDFDQFFSNLSLKTYKLIDLGQIIISDNNHKDEISFFAGSCGIGFDALAAHYSNLNKKLKGLTLYLVSVFKALRNYPVSRTVVKWEEKEYSNDSIMISIGNGKTSGGGFKLLPHASIDNGELDISIISYLNRLKILYYLPIAIFGKHTHFQIVKYFKFKECEISLNPGNYLHIDGEVISTDLKNIKIKVLPGALKFRN
ncbi:MAG: diacylglycerol kinase family protein [Ignavibacteriaceae bacterium]